MPGELISDISLITLKLCISFIEDSTDTLSGFKACWLSLVFLISFFKISGVSFLNGLLFKAGKGVAFAVGPDTLLEFVFFECKYLGVTGCLGGFGGRVKTLFSGLVSIRLLVARDIIQ
uniref:Uncharacterized protein n=1 Tax=Cacopsylla melanoneura TaxID=428564 RepID=A0A8D8VLZ3_9HEMI